MNIKKSLFVLPLLAMGMASCNLDPDPSSNYITGQFSCTNLVIPADGDAYATPADYTMTFYYTEGQVQLSATDLTFNGIKGNFVSSKMNAVTQSYLSEDKNFGFDVTSFSGGSATSGNLSIKNLKGFSSSYLNVVTENEMIKDYPFQAFTPLVISYNVNDDIIVKTFLSDAIYNGTTSVRSAMSPDAYVDSNTKYRVIFSADLQKADVLIYNAKFAEMMPTLPFFLVKGLKVEYNKTGYIISNPEGQSIIPQTLDGGTWIDNPNREISKFEFINSSDDLTSANCYFTVKVGQADFTCEFNGYYTRSK